MAAQPSVRQAKLVKKLSFSGCIVFFQIRFCEVCLRCFEINNAISSVLAGISCLELKGKLQTKVVALINDQNFAVDANSTAVATFALQI